jgi:CHAT domain-containing protein
MSDKKRRTLLLFLLLICSIVLVWQNGNWAVSSEQPLAPAKSNPDKSKNLALSESIKSDIRSYFIGITISPEENNLQYAIKLDHGVGRKAIASGNNKKGYEVYKKVLAISYHQGSLMGVGIGLGALSNIIYGMGDKAEALKITLLEYQVSRALKNRFEYGVTELRMATMLQNKDRSMSMSWRLRAQESLKGTPYIQDYVTLLSDLANDLNWVKKKDRALSVAADAWALSKKLGNSADHLVAKTRITKTYARLLKNQQQCDQALVVINELLPSFNPEQKNTQNFFNLLHLMAECHQQNKQLKLANQFFASAYSYYEQARQNALGDQNRATLDSNNWDLINDFIDTLIADKQLYTALSVLETNKARTLSDISSDSQQKKTYQQWSSLQLRHAQERVNFFDKKSDIKKSRSLEQELESIVDAGKVDDTWVDYARLLDQQTTERQAMKISLQIRNVATSESMSSEQLKKIQQGINKDSAVLSFYINNEKLFIFLLTNSSLQLIPTEFETARGRRLIQRLQTTLTNPYFDFYKAPAEELYTQLFKPIEKHLNKKIKHLIYSPDNIFSSIPLGVLSSGKEFLNNKYSILRVPSLRYVGNDNKQKNPVQGISCVDPAINGARLPFQQQTGNKLEQLFSGRLKSLKGGQCSIDLLEQAIVENQQKAFLHIGAHGFFYPKDVMKSGVYLSNNIDDSPAVLWDAKAIGATNLDDFNLITLASCETGLSDLNYSRDIFGILRTLFFSGAKSVIAPLWKVQDIATSELMQQFYVLYAKNISASTALQQAKQMLISSKQFSHPYYWSGFVMTRGIK